MTRWIVWALILAFTQGSGTMASRARNTSSLVYHGCAAFFSHSCFFVALFLNIDVIADANHDPLKLLQAFSCYALASTTGSIIAHYIAMRFFENDPSRRVGGLHESPRIPTARLVRH